MKAEYYNRFNPIKTLLYSDRLQQIADGKLPYPIIWHIYPTNKCPLDCGFCIMKNEKQKYRTQLKRKTLLKAVKEASKHAYTVHFSGGGEPLLHPDIKDAIKLAKDSGLKVALDRLRITGHPSRTQPLCLLPYSR